MHTETDTDPRLGRLVEFDERSKAYPVRTLTAAASPRSYTWPLDLVLNQGTEGACVGFAWAHELRAYPKRVPGVDQALAQRLYRRAQQLDQWPGEDYLGTSVLAGVKAAQEIGHYKQYRWAFGVEDLKVAVSRVGPAVLGIQWHASMYEPTKGSGGRWWVTMDGNVVGGHAILARGYNITLDAFCLHNSWGPRWGDNGKAWITSADLAVLLKRRGEACVPIVR